eukprot:s3267_g12.t1
MLMLSLRVASLPIISSTAAARLAGNWNSIFMFKCCLACLQNEIYGFGTDCEKTKAAVHKLPRSTAEELALCSVLSLVAVTNVTAKFSQRVYAADDSLQKGAIVSKVVSEDASRILWLGRDKKGCYTSLGPPFRDFRAMRRSYEIGLDEFDEEPDPPPASIPSAPEFQFDFVEVCGGVGSVSQALAARGSSVMPPIELSDSPHYDVRDLKLIEWLCDMLQCGQLRSLMCEPVCTTFSPAAHPAVRSYKEPMGHDMTNPKTLQGNIVAFRCLFLLSFAATCDRPALGEQPRLSKMCWLSIWKFLLELKGFEEAVIVSCQFGSQRKKEFRMIGRGLNMQKLEKRCPGGHDYVRIEGKFTKPSAVYVPALAEHIAQAFHVALRAKEAAEDDEITVAGLESALISDLLMTGN